MIQKHFIVSSNTGYGHKGMVDGLIKTSLECFGINEANLTTNSPIYRNHVSVTDTVENEICYAFFVFLVV